MIAVPESPSHAEIGAYYDTFNQHYRLVWGDHLHHGYWDQHTRSTDQAITNLLDLSATWLKINPGHHIADVGCGYGAGGLYLNRLHQCQITGYTVSKTQFDEGEKMIDRPEISILLADWIEASHRENRFDGILSLECVCHIANKHKFFQRIASTLKPGCRAVVTLLVATDRGARYYSQSLLKPLCQGAKFPNLAELDDIDYWIKRSGLHLILSENITPHVQPTWRAILFRSLKRIPAAKLSRTEGIQLGRNELLLSLNALRLQLAYWLGAVQYRFIVLEKPSSHE
ncbi:MAG: methyltransferase domain-containing protein [Verrucomicrobia bacterium]|jgi:tocopherol O-methyltransferase|nr:methyltransferase domain-containing protein [Verrucomicrobiota bacterium]